MLQFGFKLDHVLIIFLILRLETIQTKQQDQYI